MYCIALIFTSVTSPALISSNSLFFGVSVVADSTLLQQQFTDRHRATMGSLVSLDTNIAFALFSLALGYTADFSSLVTALLISQMFSFLPVLLYISLYRQKA